MSKNCKHLKNEVMCTDCEDNMENCNCYSCMAARCSECGFWFDSGCWELKIDKEGNVYE